MSARAFLSLLLALPLAAAAAQGSISGRVRGDDGAGVGAAGVSVRRGAEAIARETVTDSSGMFVIAGLPPGTYAVVARKVGFRSAELVGVRLADQQKLQLDVLLTAAPQRLSAISVVSSPTAVDVTSPALAISLDRSFTELLPSARTATSLIALVPGARKDQLWGGAPGISNNYRLDGVAMNHPGAGGDFLQLSVDWVERLDVRGLGAGAEFGDFQGGVIDARTRSGANVSRRALRANYESPALTASNFNLDEDGVEQAGRREIAGEALGAIARDRWLYFAAGQYVSRDLRSPNLATSATDFQPFREEQADARAMGKLTW
ncbi:MAG TPA: carboxypeptidase-like regulatory domain-containing protein, partial [Gemmatimonadaceae bacterium]|nr:carboxypeptidase-like regulatory domain-containing protein [Gemmatimonadaceae bacterium]